jgi:hypothetical protein
MKKVSPVLRSSLDDFPCNESLKILCNTFTNSLSLDDFPCNKSLKILCYSFTNSPSILTSRHMENI